MSKDLSTKQEKVVERPEKGSDAQSTAEWLRGVQDGLDLFELQLCDAMGRVKNPRTLTVGEVLGIAQMVADDILYTVRRLIADQCTRPKLSLVNDPPAESVARIFNLGR